MPTAPDPTPAESDAVALRERDGRYRLLLESTTTALFTAAVDGSLHPSESWEQFTGQPRSAYTGPGRGGFDMVHPDDRCALEQDWVKAVETRDQFVATYRLWHRSGEYRRVRSHVVPVHGSDGSPREWIGAITDIEDELRAREDLDRQGEVTNTITENASSALLLMDPEGQATYVNPAAVEMFGYRLDELRKGPLHDIIHHTRPDGSPYPMVECPIDQAVEQGRPREPYEDVFVRKDGTFVPVRAAASPIQRDGERIGTVVEVQDLTVEHGLRVALEASSRRAQFLAELAGKLDGYVTVHERAQQAVEVLAESFGGEASIHVSLGGKLELCGASGQSPVVSDEEAAAFIGSADTTARTIDGRHGVFLVPILARGRRYGVLAVRTSGQPPGEGCLDDSFLDEIATRLGLALDNAQLYERERTVSRTLQLGLLRGVSARIGDVRLSYAYEPGSETMAVGGDWFDVFRLPDGTVGLVVGDVVGHGLEAATEMSLLRGAVRALAVEAGPAELLCRLDAVMSSSPSDVMATLAYAQLDPTTSTVRYACAGHPPPLVMDATGGSRLLWDGRSMPLGSSARTSRRDATAELGAGDSLVLYTDGLIERRGESLDVGFGRLATSVASTGPFDEAFARRLTDRLLDGSTHDDDACVLAARIEAPGGFAHELRAAPAELADLRRELAGWLTSVGISGETANGVVLATSEAAANSVEHAYGSDHNGVTSIHAGIEAGDLHVVVRDHGTWRTPNPPGDRGRGRFLMRAIMDEVSFEHDSTGTTVRMRRRLGSGADT